MNIPFIDLESQYRKISNNINEAIREVIASKAFIMGPQVTEAEAALALFSDVKHCISCASGTDALLMALMAKNIGPGDAVFTTPFTFVSTAEVIALLGATPVFVDIDPHTYNMDPEKLQEKIEETGRAGRLSLKAVIPVDLFGQPAEFDAINALAQAHNLCVIEDAAQADTLQGVHDLTKAVHEQDIGACESVWSGLGSPSFDSGRLSTLEKAIWQFNQWWTERMIVD